MKINEILKEAEAPVVPPLKQRLKTVGKAGAKNAASGLGSFLGGALGNIGGSLSHAMNKAPGSLRADTRLVPGADDVEKIKNKASLGDLFKKAKADVDSDEAGADAAQSPDTIDTRFHDVEVPRGKRLYMIVKSNKQMYVKLANGEWRYVPSQTVPNSVQPVSAADMDKLDQLTKDAVKYAKFVDVAPESEKDPNKWYRERLAK